MNLIDEVRFFVHFPEKELQQTALLFGSIIKEKIVEGIIQGVYIDCLLDKLSETEKLQNFSLNALRALLKDQTVLQIEQKNIRKILENKILHEKESKLLSDIVLQMKKM